MGAQISLQSVPLMKHFWVVYNTMDTTLRNSKQQYNNEEMFSINYLKISIFFHAHLKCDVRELKKKYLECEKSP